MDKKKIAAVVVTYNRVALLKNCLEALTAQTYPLTRIYVVDNASTDSTADFLKSYRSGIPIEAVTLPSNEGGAGGFYAGLKQAYESGEFDAFWLMDDDGVPAADCLENLVPYLASHPYVCPLVLDIEDSSQLAFLRDGSHDLARLLKKNEGKEVVERMAAPFNGILLRRDMVEKIGYPKKDMFIWGDEVEYSYRAAHAGIFPITVLKAIHRHPKDRLVRKDTPFKKGMIIDVDSELRSYCKYRNTAYTVKKYNGVLETAALYILYSYYFLIQSRWNWKKYRLFHKAFVDGVKEDFTKHKNYLGK